LVLPMKWQTDLRKLHIQLTGQFPTLHPTVLQLTSKLPENTWAITSLSIVKGKEALLLQLRDDLGPIAGPMILFHEFAHAMDWRAEHQEGPVHHPATWGCELAKLERWYNTEHDG